MAKDPPNPFEIPGDMRAFTERSVQQARVAFDTFISAAQQAMTTFEGQAAAMRRGSDDMRDRAMAFAEQNVSASFEFAQRLVRAKDVEELVRLQTEFVQSQIAALSEQAKELGEAAGNSAGAGGPKRGPAKP
jgi:phasin